MNHPKRDERTQNQNDKKIKVLEKQERYLANFPGITGKNFEKYHKKFR